MSNESINLAVIYYSVTGTNYQMAEWAAESGRQAGAEVRILKTPELATEDAIQANPIWRTHVAATTHIPEVTYKDLEWADAIVFSIPSRFGGMPGPVKQFLDSTGALWFNGKLVNKVVSGMTSALNAHGGQEQTILSLYTSMYHWGAIVAAPGYSSPVTFEAGGNPYGTSVTVQSGKMVEDIKAAVEYQAKRTVNVAQWVKLGLAQE